MKRDKEARSFVESVRDQTEQYGQNLIRENDKLRALALAVETENTRLQAEVAEARSVIAERRELLDRVHELEREVASSREAHQRAVAQLAAIERESREYSEQYAAVMRQNATLANLYVASYTLHSTLDHAEVLSGISQIIINIVGSEQYAIFERDGDELRVVASHGVGAGAMSVVPFGSGPIGELAHSAEVRVLDPERHGMHAFIPLAIGEHVTGAIVIFELLPQKPALDDGDREMFDMLSAHAATALFCASLHERARQEPPSCTVAS